LDGEIVQHVEYVPFGEVFIEERNNTWNTPYLFNAKELDEETGLYYYGARYYDARVSQFLSVDRFAEKYPNISAYTYCANNPVKYIDPTGDTLRVEINGINFDYGRGTDNNYGYYDGDGNIYSGTNLFVNNVAQASVNIRATAEGATMLEELSSSKNVFIIKQRANLDENGLPSGNSFAPDKAWLAAGDLSEYYSVVGVPANTKGSGGIVYWNPLSTDGGFNTNNNQNRPAYIGLAHEFGHASDSNKGKLHYTRGYTNPTTGAIYSGIHNGLSKAEWTAVYRENIIRGQADIPLRTHYGVSYSTGVAAPLGPRLLDTSNRPINYP
jgi:RHS repeat-associated protein